MYDIKTFYISCVESQTELNEKNCEKDKTFKEKVLLSRKLSAQQQQQIKFNIKCYDLSNKLRSFV